jgi:hypothetical protein
LHQLTTADKKGFHVWGYSGRYEKAHCAHTTMLGPIVRDIIEPAWNTPKMNRNVPSTPAPKLGTGGTQGGSTEGDNDPVTSGPIKPEVIHLEEEVE